MIRKFLEYILVEWREEYIDDICYDIAVHMNKNIFRYQIDQLLNKKGDCDKDMRWTHWTKCTQN